jgi:putative membrane-bound dehydrogenase-like protein
MTRILLAAGALAVSFAAAAPGPRPADVPRASDPRLVVELFAAAPDVVQPIGLAFDRRGRLLVIESHTHFRPENYKGPVHDRIRVLEDTDGDGKADRITTFYEGTRATMGLAAHPDGSVYVATRNEILRLRDTHGDGKADECRRIAFLDTRATYPHNGLSSLAFDSQGDLYFGMGENEGADYKLIGADGTTLTGAGEGGNVFHCRADGTRLRRVATGFWNPFGLCRDVFGRVFAVDNDPDAMPPCRLVHVAEGGDYGYQYRYGRSGRHPFQSWHGELPGTLPMVSGVGEAPCQVLSYESDGLPREHLGQLLVASWADHRIERYPLEEHGASYAARRQPFVQGGKDFRPVGIAVAPDGSLFVSDWVRSDYTLHGQGAVWHVRLRERTKPDRPQDPRRALASAHRPLREVAARRLAGDEAGREFLRKQLDSPDVRTRAASLTALLDAGESKLDLGALAGKETVTPLRAFAVRALAARREDATRFLDARQPGVVRVEAVASLKRKADVPRLLDLLADKDPFLRHAAVEQLAHAPELLADVPTDARTDPTQRLGVLLAWRASGAPEGRRLVRRFLADPDEGVRFLAAKWVADEKLAEYRPQLAAGLKDRTLNVRLYLAYATALARIDGRDPSEKSMADFFFGRLADAQTSPAVRVMALQMVPPTYPKLTPDLLSGLLKQADPALRLEAARALSENPSPRRLPLLREAAHSPALGDEVRAQAVLGLADRPDDFLNDLLAFARGDDPALRDEALRALTGARLSPAQQGEVKEVAGRHPEAAALVARVLGQPFTKDRPAAGDLGAWLKRLDGPADAAAGRRVFFHPRLAGCFRCHRAEGHGQEIGPDLSTVGRNERRHTLESILQPSNLVAPNYQAWRIETKDGNVRTGMLLNTELDEYTYVDAKGARFKVNTRDVVEGLPLTTSIMPDGLADLLTDQELRDLMAYLDSRR